MLLQPGETTSDPTQLRADGTPKANAVRHLVDICDELQGRYPKDFKFTGWHPHCRCHVITILKTEEEMKQDTQRILRGEDPTPDSVNSVDELPPNFTEWVQKRKGKLTNATNPPYFIKDNRAAVNGILGIGTGNAKEITPKKRLSLLEIAEQRHAKRTQEQVDDIIRRARERDINNLTAYLQRYGEFTEYPDANDTHFQTYRGMEKAFERLTPEQRLEVLRRGKFSGMLNPDNFFGYEVPDIYMASTKQRMIDRVKEELDNKFIGNDVEDTNHYIVCLKSGKIIDTAELEKRLSAKQYEDALWISANEGLSSYQYWYKDEKARNMMIEYMGFDEWKDGRVIVRSKWSPWKDDEHGKLLPMSVRGKVVGFEEYPVRRVNKLISDIEKLNASLEIFPKGVKVSLSGSLEESTLYAWKDGEVIISTGIHSLEDGTTFSPSRDLINAFVKLKAKLPLSFKEEYAIEGLFHESVHSRIKKLKYSPNSITEIILEGCTQMYAREKYPKILKHFETLPRHQEAIRTNGYGYKGVVDTLRPFFTVDGKVQIGELINIAIGEEDGLKKLLKKIKQHNLSKTERAQIIEILRLSANGHDLAK